MSVASMTGFGRAEVDAGALGAIVWELRSVNGKSLDIRLRLPPGLESLEPEIRRRAAGRLSRGNLQVSVQVTRPEAPTGPVPQAWAAPRCSPGTSAACRPSSSLRS